MGASRHREWSLEVREQLVPADAEEDSGIQLLREIQSWLKVKPSKMNSISETLKSSMQGVTSQEKEAQLILNRDSIADYLQSLIAKQAK